MQMVFRLIRLMLKPFIPIGVLSAIPFWMQR